MESEFYATFEFRSQNIGFYAKVYGPFENYSAADSCISVILEKSKNNFQARIIEGQNNLEDWGNGKSDYAFADLTDRRQLPESTGDLDPRFPRDSDLSRLIDSIHHVDSKSFDLVTGEVTEHAWPVYRK